MAKRSAPLLKTYWSKRNFARTPEPAGDKTTKAGAKSYVIQKHSARRLHFDFRLELDGVLKSWAVPQGPSFDPTKKRLAVRTEDHPLEYGGFEGLIPEGEYGAGPVMLWDRGTWEPKGDAHEGLERGVLKFELAGERLKGGFALVRLRPEGKRENWLLVKERDEWADPDVDPVEEWTTSVASARDFDAIRHGNSAVWHSDRPAAGRKQNRRAKPQSRAKLPQFIEPQLATPADDPPQGEGWLHEIKYDGYRLLAAVAGDRVRLNARSGLDWTKRLPHLAASLQQLPVKSALLDGEIVVLDARGRSSFQLLQQGLKNPSSDILYYAFDLLELDGKDVRDEPLEQRKERLRKILGSAPPEIVFSDHIAGDGQRVLKEASLHDLEGIVSKRANKPYRSGRSPHWIKTKHLNHQEFVIGGYRRSTKGRGFASLLLGEFEGKNLHYRGRVGTGFDGRMIQEIASKLASLERPTSPFVDAPPSLKRDTRWVEPQLVAQVAFTERTSDGYLRQPSFLGLREDKSATEVTTETTIAKANGKNPRTRNSAAKRVKTNPTNADISDTAPLGVKLTHPEKVLYPKQQITKAELVRYFMTVAPLMVPHVRGRPLSFVRCPEGSEGQCFFQKHRKPGMPQPVKSVPIREDAGKTAQYLMIEDAAGLVGAAQVGALEIHIWGSRGDKVELPDRLVFDLDPDAGLDFDVVRHTALQFRDLLGAVELQTFPMVTGGKGIHIVAPLARRNSWDEVKGFAKAFAERLAATDPQSFTSVMSKKKRRGKIFVDWLRNDRGSTAISPYSPRARDGAPIAHPVSWRELKTIEGANTFTLRNTMKRLASITKDPWEGYFDIRQSITKSALRAFSAE
jgi:bifunctional non-homologous end joining protein LigD